MNKLLIVLLAVCLISVVSAHSFVKRDAPTPTATDDIMSKFNELKDHLTDLVKKGAESINTEEIQKKTKEATDLATKMLNDVQTAVAAALATPAPAAAGDAKPAAQ